VVGCSPVRFEASLGSGSSNITSSSWYLDNQLVADSSPISANVFLSGIYDLTVVAESDFGCFDTLTVQEILEVDPAPFAEFTITPSELSTVDHVATFQNASTGASLFNWDFAGLSQSYENSPVYDFPFNISQTFQICLEAVNEYGCADSVCHFLPLVNEYVFYAPNAFSPDNDGINDVFIPVFQGFDNSTYHLQIFDRWGEKVFETTDPNQAWTGNVRGGSYYGEGGIYVWQVQLKERDIAEIKKFRGHVTMLR
jgi:gliding motility-associated-like protein